MQDKQEEEEERQHPLNLSPLVSIDEFVFDDNMFTNYQPGMFKNVIFTTSKQMKNVRFTTITKYAMRQRAKRFPNYVQKWKPWGKKRKNNLPPQLEEEEDESEASDRSVLYEYGMKRYAKYLPQEES